MTDLFNKLGISKRHLTTMLVSLLILLNKKLNLGLSDDSVAHLVYLVLGYVGMDTVGKFSKSGGSSDWLQQIWQGIVAKTAQSSVDKASQSKKD